MRRYKLNKLIVLVIISVIIIGIIEMNKNEGPGAYDSRTLKWSANTTPNSQDGFEAAFAVAGLLAGGFLVREKLWKINPCWAP